LQAAIANIKNDETPGGKRHNFEASASYLLPKDPVTKHINNAGSKRVNAAISDVHVEPGSGTKTGLVAQEFTYGITRRLSILSSCQSRRKS